MEKSSNHPINPAKAHFTRVLVTMGLGLILCPGLRSQVSSPPGTTAGTPHEVSTKGVSNETKPSSVMSKVLKSFLFYYRPYSGILYRADRNNGVICDAMLAFLNANKDDILENRSHMVLTSYIHPSDTANAQRINSASIQAKVVRSYVLTKMSGIGIQRSSFVFAFDTTLRLRDQVRLELIGEPMDKEANHDIIYTNSTNKDSIAKIKTLYKSIPFTTPAPAPLTVPVAIPVPVPVQPKPEPVVSKPVILPDSAAVYLTFTERRLLPSLSPERYSFNRLNSARNFQNILSRSLQSFSEGKKHLILLMGTRSGKSTSEVGQRSSLYLNSFRNYLIKQHNVAVESQSVLNDPNLDLGSFYAIVHRGNADSVRNLSKVDFTAGEFTDTLVASANYVFRPYLGIKTNLLYWAGVTSEPALRSMTPNVELEWYFRKHFSLNLDATYSYIKKQKDTHQIWGLSSIAIEPRYWLTSDGSFKGFYAGLSGQYGDFDVKLDKISKEHGYTGTFWDGSLSLGYYAALTSHLGLEIGLKGGYQNVEYKAYVPENSGFYEVYSDSKSGLALTGLRILLVYRLGHHF
jgi:hypothetical protein